jgi:hypothetical protein
VFLWRSLRPDALTIFLRYLASRGGSAVVQPATEERPRTVEAADSQEAAARR